jgi:hypothetical protein
MSLIKKGVKIRSDICADWRNNLITRFRDYQDEISEILAKGRHLICLK